MNTNKLHVMAGIGWLVKILSDLFLQHNPAQDFVSGFAIGVTLFCYIALIIHWWQTRQVSAEKS